MRNPPRDSFDNGWTVYRRLLGYVRPYWSAFIFAVVGMGGVAATEVSFAGLIKPMLDDIFVKRDPLLVNLIPAMLVSVFVIRGIASFTSNYAMAWIGRYVIKDIRTEMFDHLLLLPTRFYDKSATGQLISKLIYDVEQVADASSKAITVLIQDSLTLVGLLGWMFYLNWKLSLLFLLMGPLVTLLVRYVNKRLRRVSRRLQDSMGDVTHASQEAIEAHRVVKIFGGYEHERDTFAAINENNRRQNMKIVSTNAASVPIIQLVAAFMLAGVIYASTHPPLQDSMTVGTFMSLISAMLLLLPPLKRLTTVNATLQRGIAAAQSMFRFLAEERETDSGEQTLERARGAIEFQELRFSYGGDKGDVLHDIDLRIEPGETVAFVGRSGSGKSTLVSLLPRFYNVDHGRINVDGHDVRNIRLADLRRQIALVSQDITLFNDTIAHNIAYGNENVIESHIVRAAETAHAMEFINEFPQGMGTMVGEHGVLLSGGQRQRIAIARAIFKDAPILILDEATSALDTHSERHIQAALDDLMRNRTTLVIAHRLSTIEKADKIVVLNEGRIVEVGSHGELLARGGHYAALHQMQFNDGA